MIFQKVVSTIRNGKNEQMTKKMINDKCKILICTGIFPPDIGGPATYGKTIANALAERGFGIQVITYIDAKSLKFKVKNEKLKSKFKNLKISRVSGRWPKGFKHLIFFFKVFFMTRKTDAVLALNAVSAGLPALMCAKLFKKRFIVRIVGDYAWEVGVGKGKINVLIDDFQKIQKSGRIKLLYDIQSRVCKNANTVIVPSKYLRGIVKGWGVPDSKIKVIYNGAELVPAGISKEEARRKIGIHGNIVLSVGRLVPWKGFRMLIKTMPRLLDLKQFARLVVVGDGPDRKSLELMIKNMGLENKIFITGKKSKEELAVYFAASDIFILNSGYEGFSHLILEAMSCGVPVVASAVGGNREVIKQGENGFLVRYNDDFNLVEAVKTIWQNNELKSELIENGKKTAKKFSSEKMVSQTLELLDRP